MKWINSIIHSWGALAPCNMFIYIIVSRVNSCIFVSKWCSQNGHILNINIFMYLIVLIFLPIISFLNYFKLGNKLFTKKKKNITNIPKNEILFLFILRFCEQGQSEHHEQMKQNYSRKCYQWRNVVEAEAEDQHWSWRTASEGCQKVFHNTLNAWIR